MLLAESSACLKCNHKPVAGDANFCVNCGWPLRQPCPYAPSCDASVPLQTEGEPTASCPACNRAFLYCPCSGKLHRIDEHFSTAPGCEGVRLLAPRPGWPCEGGGPGRLWSAASKAELQIPDTEPKPNLLAIKGGVAIGPVLHAVGAIIFTTGPIVHTASQTEEQEISLNRPLPAESWRALVMAGRLYCVQPHSVEIVDLANRSWLSSFSGEFIAQTQSGDHWVGVASDNGVPRVEFRSENQKSAEHRLDSELAIDLRSVVGTDQAAFLAFDSGRVYRLTLNEKRLIADAIPGAVVRHLSSDGTSLFLLLLENARGAVRVLDADGALQRKIDLDLPSLFQHPVVMGRRMYVMDDGEGTLVVCDLASGEVAQTISIPNVRRIQDFVGFYHGVRHLLLIATDIDQNARGRVFVYDPVTGESMRVCSINREIAVRLLIANGSPAVALSAEFEKSIRVYDFAKHTSV